jgi:hypothetical protein
MSSGVRKEGGHLKSTGMKTNAENNLESVGKRTSAFVHPSVAMLLAASILFAQVRAATSQKQGNRNIYVIPVVGYTVYLTYEICRSAVCMSTSSSQSLAYNDTSPQEYSNAATLKKFIS